jgi:hypothetical protein
VPVVLPLPLQEIRMDERDIEFLGSMGIDEIQVNRQLEMLRRGTRYANLVRAAIINDGIVKFSEEEQKDLVSIFTKASKEKKIIKFVPASGAATRMFQVLLDFYHKEEEIHESEIKKKVQDKENNYIFLLDFTNGLKNKKFAFFDDLKKSMEKEDLDLDSLIKEGKYKKILNTLLMEKGLNYSHLPKALIKFHQYGPSSRTALEEHLIEGIAYAKDKTGTVNIHFTLSPEFLKNVSEYINEITPHYIKKNITFNLNLSPQKPNTSTIAVDENNNLLKTSNNVIVLRPGGHGALLQNLNDLDGDIIFIKNIDNVVPDRLREQTVYYKKILGGYLIKLQKKIFHYLERLHGSKQTENELLEIIDFTVDDLHISLDENFSQYSPESKKTILIKKLNRPIRICGMVENKGEPGGGPFWIKNSQGEISLQIIEGAQIDKNLEDQNKILQRSTHFNPVDLVCGIRDFKGEKFDLNRFVDPETYFISKKTWSNQSIKALEYPGLWNGAMADWITIFIEVPLITFNPIKTVNDLLRPEHQ